MDFHKPDHALEAGTIPHHGSGKNSQPVSTGLLPKKQVNHRSASGALCISQACSEAWIFEDPPSSGWLKMDNVTPKIGKLRVVHALIKPSKPTILDHTRPWQSTVNKRTDFRMLPSLPYSIGLASLCRWKLSEHKIACCFSSSRGLTFLHHDDPVLPERQPSAAGNLLLGSDLKGVLKDALKRKRTERQTK